jgi:hypothetical protein
MLHVEVHFNGFSIAFELHSEYFQVKLSSSLINCLLNYSLLCTACYCNYIFTPILRLLMDFTSIVEVALNMTCAALAKSCSIYEGAAFMSINELRLK